MGCESNPPWKSPRLAGLPKDLPNGPSRPYPLRAEDSLSVIGLRPLRQGIRRLNAATGF